MTAVKRTPTRRGVKRPRVSQRLKERVRIKEYSDLEILSALADLGATTDQGVGSEPLAQRLFGAAVRKREALQYAKKCCGARLSWMGRVGQVERIDDGWALTAEGALLLKTRLRPQMASAVLDIAEGGTLHLAATVGERIQTTGEVGFRAMERQLRHSIAKRKIR